MISHTIKAITGMMLTLALIGGPLMSTAQAEGKIHRIAMHLDEKDPARMNLVLNNAVNVRNYYTEQGDEVQIEIVAYGPGLHMLRADTSPVKDRLQTISDSFDDISFRACGNTHRKMSAKAGKDVELLPQAKMVTSGVVHLVQRQEEGWAYVRP